MISSFTTIVVYWPTTWPGCQNRKCTCVNKRCIQSRNIRIITLTVDRLNECEIVTPTRRRWALNYYITQVKTGSESVWRSDQLEIRCGRESQHPAEGALRPPIESWGSDELEVRCGRENQHPERLGPQAPGWAAQENGKEPRLWSIEWGSICCSSISNNSL